MATPVHDRVKQNTLMSADELWRMPPGFSTFVPDLMVEVISPSESSDEIQDKLMAYLNAGMRMLWIELPRTRTVTVYRSLQNARILTAGDTLSGEDVVSGFTCQAGDIFV